MSEKSKLRGITPEHIMLVVLLILGTVFYVRPITEGYPDNASQFPQLTSAVVLIGSVLLLLRNYLPGFLGTFVGENVSITDTDETMEEVAEVEGDEVGAAATATDTETETETEATTETERRTLGDRYGIEINDTVFMMVLSTIYLIVGYAVGLLYATPVFVFAYTQWFRVPWYIGLGLAVAATLIIVGFIQFLLLPFDRGEIIVIFGQVLI